MTDIEERATVQVQVELEGGRARRQAMVYGGAHIPTATVERSYTILQLLLYSGF